jgi:hypothetical protein
MKEQGVEGLLHGSRGKRAWNKTASEKLEKVIQLAREHLAPQPLHLPNRDSQKFCRSSDRLPAF